MYIPHIIIIHLASDIHQTDRHKERQQPHPIPLWLSRLEVHWWEDSVHAMWVSPAVGLRLSVCPAAGLWIPVSLVAGIWTHEPPRPQARSHCWQSLTHAHTDIQSWLRLPWSPSSQPTVVSPIETHNSRSHPWRTPDLQPVWQLAGTLLVPSLASSFLGLVLRGTHIWLSVYFTYSPASPALPLLAIISPLARLHLLQLLVPGTHRPSWPKVPLQLLALKSTHSGLSSPCTTDTWSLQPVLWPQWLHLDPTHTCAHRTEPSPGKELERNLTSRQDRLRWPGAGHGQTSVVTSTLSAHDWPFFNPSPLYFPTLVHPQVTSGHPFPCLWFLSYTSHKQLCANPKYLHRIMCPIPLGSNSPQVLLCYSPWWVSQLNTGAETLLGHPWEGSQTGCILPLSP